MVVVELREFGAQLIVLRVAPAHHLGEHVRLFLGGFEFVNLHGELRFRILSADVGVLYEFACRFEFARLFRSRLFERVNCLLHFRGILGPLRDCLLCLT